MNSITTDKYSDINCINWKLFNNDEQLIRKKIFESRPKGYDILYYSNSSSIYVPRCLRNTCLKGAKFNDTILTKINLSYANLSYANLSSTNLSYANLNCANLSLADLRKADLNHANLSFADLSMANFSYADLSSANLSFADLSSANLSKADLRYANLSKADLRYANLYNIKYNKITKWKKARYNSKTKFLEGFDPETHGMIFED